MAVKMVAVQCPKCNGTITQEDAKDGLCTCEFCGNTFIIDDNTPKTYITKNTTVNINYNNGGFNEQEILSDKEKRKRYKLIVLLAFSPFIVFLIIALFAAIAMVFVAAKSVGF